VVKDILDSLTPREAKVLRMRFGIEMSTDHTLEEVGKQFDVTRERIRQIEAKAIRKLKHPFEPLGNAEATSVVTHTVNHPGYWRGPRGGQVGQDPRRRLMAVFEMPAPPCRRPHSCTTPSRPWSQRAARGASTGLRGLRLQVALAAARSSRWAATASATPSTWRLA
jgi:hypothetical protein